MRLIIKLRIISEDLPISSIALLWKLKQRDSFSFSS